MISGRKSFFLIFLVFFLSHSFAQLNSSIYHYSIAEGLSDNRIHSIIKDSRGFIWIGTWVGINRFDGHNFLTFKSNPGDNSNLKSNRIDEIVDDGKNALWLRAYDKQVYKFDKLSGQFLALSTILKDKALDKILFSRILLADDQNVWLRSEQGSLYMLSGLNTPQPSCRRFSVSEKRPFKLSSKDLAFTYVDRDGNIWVGSSGGLDVIEKKNGTYTSKTYLAAGKGLTHLSIVGTTAFATTSDGAIVIFNKQSGVARKIKISDGTINSIHASRKGGKVYCSTTSGELIAIGQNGRVEKLSVSPDGSPYFSVFEDSRGRVWVESATHGIISVDPVTGKTTYVSRNSNIRYTTSVKNCYYVEDRQGTLWFNLRGKGFFYFDSDAGKMVPFNYNRDRTASSVPDRVNALFYDTQGVIWLGTEGGGVKKVIIQSKDFKKLPFNFHQGLENENEVRGILTDRKNRVWAGTKAGSVLLFQNGEIKWPLKTSDSPKAGVYCFLQDRKGRIWIGTKGDGLYKAEPVDASSTNYTVRRYLPGTNTIYTIFEDEKGRIWAGSFGGGLILIDESRGDIRFKTVANTFEHYPKGNYSRIRHLAEDSKGNIWIGTTDGLLVFNPNVGAPQNFRFSLYKKQPGNIHSLGGNDVQFIFCDSDKQMWVLTSSGGLNKAIGASPLKNLTFKNYSTKEGLPSDFLFSCTEDKHKNLWLATQNGISRYSKKHNRFQNFGASYGLSDVSFSEASVTRMQDGQIVFGTKDGLLQFNPGSVSSDKVETNLVFTGLHVNSEEVLPGEQSVLKTDLNDTEEIVLSHDQNIISIDFSVLDYRSSSKEDYKVRLLGLDDTWRSNEGQTRVTYTKLPPGKYVFQVKSDNPELYKVLPSHARTITILPPPWKTFWAYLFYTFVVFVLFIIARRIMMTMLKLKQTVEVERRVANLKLSFFTQVSHELRTPLSLIINPSEEVLEKENLSDKGTEYIKVVVKNARRMARLVNQLLDLRKVESGKAGLKVAEIELSEFCRNVTGYFKEVVERRNLTLKIIPTESQLRIWADSEKLDIILYNLLANAVKFSPDVGEIEISIDVDNGQQKCHIEVRDNGIGVEQDELEKIFNLYYQSNQESLTTVKGTGIGLALSRELVELHGGKISARRNVPAGLVVTLELPLGKGHFNSENAIFIDNSSASDKDVSVENEPWQAALEGIDEHVTNKPSILIVEDNDDLRNFLAAKLSGRYKVNVAADGQQGLEKAAELMPDLVLSDIMMPKMDGIEMLDKIKNNPALSHIPVILLTARHSVASQIDGLKYGADFYITKPFDPELLEVAVRRFLSQRRQFFESLSTGTPDANPQPEAEKPSITAHDRAFLEKVIQIVEERLDDTEFNVDAVADSIGMSRSAFFKKFKSLTNIAPVEFVRETRLKKAKELFDAGEDNISTVAFSVGFNHPTYFSTCFKAQFQKTPREYLKSLKMNK